MDAESGTISINASGSSTGAFTVATSATNRFSGGTYTLDAGTNFTGTGRALLSGGTLNVAANVSVPVFELTTGGTLTGAASLTVTDTLTWNGGKLSGTGSTDIAAGATFSIITSSGIPTTLNTRTLNNAGGAVWTGNGGITFANGAVFNNTGHFTAQNSVNFINGGGMMSVCNNIGDFTKTGSTAESDFPSVAISGAATFAGALDVFLVDGFAPNVGNTFQVLTYSSRSGVFDTVADNDSAHRFNPTYNAANLTLTVA